MRNAELEEAQAGMKMAGRNINNLRYADDTTLMAESESESEVAQCCPTLWDPMGMAESEEELKSLLMKVKVESEKIGLKLPSLHGK